LAFPFVEGTNTGSQDSQVTSHVINLPTGISAGDLLIVFISMANELYVSAQFPVGFTKLFDVIQGQGADNGLVAGYRQADGGEGPTITVTTTGSTRSAHTSYRISGAEDPGTQEPEFSTTIGTNSSADSPSLTPTGGAADFLWFSVGGSSHAGTYTSAPTNYINLIQAANPNNAAGHTIGGSAQRDLNVASEDPVAFVHDQSASSEWVAATVAIHPGGVGQEFQQAVSGALTFIGTLATQLNKNQAVAGALNFVGSLVKETSKGLAGVLASIGISDRAITKVLSGVLSFVGLFRKEQLVFNAGGLAFTGSVIKQVGINLSGVLAFVGTVANQRDKLLAGVLAFAGNVAKQQDKLLSGVLNFSGSLIKETSRLLSGVLGLIGIQAGQTTFLRDVGQGTLGLAGSLVKETTKLLSGVIFPVGTLVSEVTKRLGGVLNFTGTLVKQTTTSLAGVLGLSGTLGGGEAFIKNIAGSLAMSGSLIRETTKQLFGNLTLFGIVSKAISTSLSGVLGLAGTIGGLVLPPGVSIISLTLRIRTATLTLKKRLTSLNLRDR